MRDNDKTNKALYTKIGYHLGKLRKPILAGLFVVLAFGLEPRISFANELADNPSEFINEEDCFFDNEYVNNADMIILASEEASYTATQTDGDYTYAVENGSAVILAYSGSNRNVIIPSTLGAYPVKSLGNYLFANNKNIDSVTIPEGVTSTGKMLFASSSVKTVNLPSTWQFFYLCMFSDCDQLTAINVSTSNPIYHTINGDLYSKDETRLVFYAGGKLDTTFTIPATVTKIGRGFDSAVNLQVLNVPDSVQTVEYSSFGGYSIKIINIGTGLQDIEGWAFGEGLEQINVDPNNPYLSSDSGVLYNKDKTKIIAYPASKAEISFTAPPSVIDIGKYAFDHCINIQEVIFPSKINSLESAAFNYCNSPTYIKGNLKRIIFRNGINQNNISPDAMWACRAILVGDDSVRQATQNITESFDFDPDTCYLSPDLSQATLIIKDQEYTGNPLTPTLKINDSSARLEEGKDYTASYENNINAGQAIVTITGKGEFSGSTSGTFTITRADIYNTTITLPETVLYSGEPCTPKPTITRNGMVLQEGKDYTLSYEDNDSPSNFGSIGITGIGNYEGFSQFWFNIEYNNTPDSSDGNNLNNDKADQTGNWIKDSTGWWYKRTDGTYPSNTWQHINGSWYHFNKAGYMQTGWIQLKGSWYYLSSSGAMATGWQKVNGTWYYLNNSGIMQTGWIRLGAKWYYLASSGAMQTGWLKQGNAWYYLNPNGVMATGWVSVKGTWYHMSSSGAMQTGWQKINNAWYYLNSSGAMLTGWYTVGTNWYYSNAAGAMQANKWVGNYYLTESGAMATNTWIGKYHVNNNGAWDKTA